MKAATQHIMDIVASFFAASDDSFQAGYTVGAGSSSKTAMMAPVHSKESASKLGSMYFRCPKMLRDDESLLTLVYKLMKINIGNTFKLFRKCSDT